MYTYEYSKISAILVGVLSGNDSSDDDYEALYNSIITLDRECTFHPDGTTIFMVVDRKHARPNATWRRRFGEMPLKAEKKLSIVITQSRLIMSAITAINWIASVPFFYGSMEKQNSTVRVFKTIEGGIAWFEERQGRQFPLIQKLYKSAQRKSREIA